ARPLRTRAVRRRRSRRKRTRRRPPRPLGDRGGLAMTVGRLMGAAITTAATTVALWTLGLEALFALSAGVLIWTIVIAESLRDGEPAPELHDETATAWRGSAVSRLAWGFNPRTDVAGEIVARRVRTLLRRRLARLGIDIDDPAQTARVDAAIGD